MATITAPPAGSTSLDEFYVLVGRTRFDPGADWPGYIEKRLNEGFDKAAGGIAKAAQAHLNNVVKWVEHFHGSRPWNGKVRNESNRLQRRSGGTIEAFKKSAKVAKTGPGLNTVDAKVNVGVFGIHLDGGVIRARRSKYLTIPLPPAMDRRGVPLKKSARDWPDTFVMKSKKGNLLICQRRGDKVVPLYLLKSSVRIPPRLNQLPGIWDAYVNRYERALIAEIERSIDAIVW